MTPPNDNGAGLQGPSVPEFGSPELVTLSPASVEALARCVAVAVGPVRPLVSTERAAEFLDVPASWLATQARNGSAPCRRLGKYVKFDLVELRAWIDATAASGPVTGCGLVPASPTSEQPSALTRAGLVEVPSVVPSRDRRAA